MPRPCAGERGKNVHHCPEQESDLHSAFLPVTVSFPEGSVAGIPLERRLQKNRDVPKNCGGAPARLPPQYFAVPKPVRRDSCPASALSPIPSGRPLLRGLRRRGAPFVARRAMHPKSTAPWPGTTAHGGKSPRLRSRSSPARCRFRSYYWTPLRGDPPLSLHGPPRGLPPHRLESPDAHCPLQERRLRLRLRGS
jgi:hypothetical protein